MIYLYLYYWSSYQLFHCITKIWLVSLHNILITMWISFVLVSLVSIIISHQADFYWTPHIMLIYPIRIYLSTLLNKNNQHWCAWQLEQTTSLDLTALTDLVNYGLFQTMCVGKFHVIQSYMFNCLIMESNMRQVFPPFLYRKLKR